jgi:acyl transferase domain-containing protein
MLVGGADGTNNPLGYMSFAKTHALSPRGKSRTFDESADGIALGEGIACIVLKRLPDAQRDGDKIYAVIKGIGSSSDGKNRSLTAPHPPGQIRAVSRAYEDARCSPSSVTLIEAHGTGTAVGDSAELTTLTELFAQHTEARQYVAVGSVKSMIGHTKTVAGLASVIKAALALRHRVLPPTIGVEKPTPRVDWAQSPFYLNSETRPWIREQDETSRRAGVSSFGFGGTNFHVVLEEHSGEYSRDVEGNWMPREVEVFVLRRANRDEIVHDLRHLQQSLESAPSDDLAGLAQALFAEESKRTVQPPPCRLAIVASSAADLSKKIQRAISLLPDHAELNDPSGIYFSERTPARTSEVCFLYPGQGSQSVNMLRDLLAASPSSHDLFLEANRLLTDDLPNTLSRYIYPPPVFTDAEREHQAAALKDTRIAQPALGLVELFATDFLARYHIRPAFAAGHSYGEYVALHVAGCLSRADLLKLSAYRGRVCAEAAQSSPGGMAAVHAGASVTETALKDLNIAADVANLNGPDQTVIAGPVEAIDAAIEQLSKRGLRTRIIPVSAAFHTTRLCLAAEAMQAHLHGIAFQRPGIPVYSNTTGRRHAEEPDSIRALLSRHLSEPVLFEKEVRQLFADGARVFVEVGPGRVLTDLVSRIFDGALVTALPLDAPGRDGWTQLGHLLARLTVIGLPVRLDAWFEGRGFRSQSIEEFIARVHAEAAPKPTDWLLSPNMAQPITSLPSRKSNTIPDSERGSVHLSGDAKKSTPAKPANVPPVSVSNGHSHPSDTRNSRAEKVLPAMTTTNGHPSSNGEVHGRVPSGNHLYDQFQATTRLLLEAQQAQNRVLERYLETQERILLHCTQGASAQTGQLLSESLSPLTTISPSSPPPHVRPAPAVARPPVPIPRRDSVAPIRLSVAARAPVHPESAEPTNPRVENQQPASDSGPGDGPPPTEKFRQDLLDVVSARTGYPIDALDEALALEAELGIDSIKTVEIFSNLKAYHAYFRAENQEEEELLAEFTKLKTLRDILDAYDRRRQAYFASSVRNGVIDTTADKSSDADKVNGTIHRYTVTPVAAPLEQNGVKKNDSP